MIVTSSLPIDVPTRLYEEDDLQRSVVQYLRWALPPDAEYYHIPNGGMRSKRVAARLVGLGVRAGMPDLALVWRGIPLFVELKTPRGVVDPVQRQMHDKLSYCGAYVTVCRSVTDVEHWLRQVGVPLQASTNR